MEDILILAAVVALAIPAAIVWLIIAVSGLRARVRQLEAMVGAGALPGRAAMPYTPPLADPVPEPLPGEVAASVRQAAGNAVAETEPPATDTPRAEPPPIPPSAMPSPAVPPEIIRLISRDLKLRERESAQVRYAKFLRSLPGFLCPDRALLRW